MDNTTILEAHEQEIIDRCQAIGNDDKWRDIESCPENEDVFFAAYITPSEEAARNGSMAFWNYGHGRKLGKIYTGILGGKPTHWQPALPPTTLSKGGES